MKGFVMEMKRTVLVRITGRVQGVSFRVWTLREAELLGLSGWVRNEADGSVKAKIAGSNEAVTAMIRRLREGPRGAVVEAVTVEETGEAPEQQGFRITG